MRSNARNRTATLLPIRNRYFIGERRLTLLALGLAAALGAACVQIPPPPPGGNGNDNDNDNDNGTGADPTTYIGAAAVLQGTILGQNLAILQLGPLPDSGGALEASLTTTETPGILAAEIAHAAVVGAGQITRSEAGLANIDLTVGDHKLTADFLMSRATAQCINGVAEVHGDFEFTNLVIDGASVATNTAPNQEVVLRDLAGNAVGRVVLNEQIETGDSQSGEITVNGLHIEVTNVADVVLFHARAGVKCGTPNPPADFVSGSGFFDAPSGGVAQFALAGGIVNGQFKGHLNFRDQMADLIAFGLNVTSYETVDADTRRIRGDAWINGQTGTYEMIVADKGEPSSGDTFRLVLSNGYEISGVLKGGNIQLHSKAD